MALTNKLKAIADAIRGKTGKTEEMTLDQMVTEIEGIEAGGGSDNSLLHSLVDRSITSFVDNEITKIGNYAFAHCGKLTEFSAPNAIDLGNYMLYYADNVTELVFPKAKTLCYNCLERCHGLVKLDLHVCHMIYGTSLRYNSKFNTLILRRTEGVVTLVHTNAFSSTPFDTAGSGAKVYVPAALIESYQAATNWSTLYAANKLTFVAIEGSEYE